MINVSQNGIKAIIKMTHLSIYLKQDESVGLRAHRQVRLSPC